MATLLLGTTVGGFAAIHAGNIAAQSVNYANSAGSVAWTNVSGRPTALSQFTNDLGNYGNWITASALSGYATQSWVQSYYSPIAYVTDSFVDFYIYGDQNKYYPVTIHNWNGGHGFQRYSIHRGYSWSAPWDPIGTGVHQGGLTFTFEWSGDIAWGGNDKTIRVIQFGETYTQMVAGMQLAHCEGVVVWLRGGGPGGAHYRLHGPGGKSQSYSINMSSWTSCAGVTYSPRDYASDVINSEINNRYPVRNNTDLYYNNNIVATESWVQSRGYLTSLPSHNHDSAYVPLSRTITINGVAQDLTANRSWTVSGSDSTKLPLAGGTMTGKIFGPSMGSDVYGGLIEIRERDYVSNSQSAWSYSPALTFHWGNRAAIRFGLRSDGLMAVDENPIVIQNGGTWNINITGNSATATSASSATTATNAYKLLASSNKSHYLGESSSWDGVGFGSLTNLHFQGHDHFWVGAGNAYWYRGGISTEHDLLITTMYGYSSQSYYRGITFAVENNGNGSNGGYRLGRWQTYGGGWTTARLQVDASLSVGYGARGTRAYDEAKYPLDRGVWAHGRDQADYGSDRIRDYLFSPTANGGGPWGSFASLEVSSPFDGNSDIPALFRMHQWGSGAVEFWKPQGTTLFIRESPGGGGSWFTKLSVQGNQDISGFLNVNGATEHTINDNDRLVGSNTNNRVFINGSIQLTNNNDAIVIGRGTATFLSDEELGFGWGGGWYMTDSTYLRVRNDKALYSRGDYYANGYRGSGNVGGTGEASWHPAGIYSGSTQWLYGHTYRNSANTYGQGQIYFDSNYGYGLVGLYSSTRYQAIFAMGDSYKLPVDGTSTGSLYGLAWSHPNAGGVASNLNTHGLLVMENGTFLAAISGSIRARDDVRAPALYDSGSRVAISRGEGRNYVDYARYVYNNGAYSGSGWVEPSDLGVRYAASANYATSAGSASSVAWGNVSGRPGWMTAASLIEDHSNANDWRNSGFYENGGCGSNWPSCTWYNSINVRHSNQGNYHGFQIAMSYYDNNLWFRSYQGSGTFQSWAVALSNQNFTSYIDAPNRVGTSYYQVQTWLQLNGSHGLYAPSYYNAHFYPNTASSYTQWAADGNKNGYGGFYDVYSRVNGVMYDSAGNGGVYREGNGLWYFYYHVGNNCMGVGTSTTSSSYQMYVNGNIYATGDIIAYSDSRKKTNIETVENALEKVLSMRGVFYDKVDELEKGRQVGVIAQEMNEVLPEAVTYASDVDEYGVKYGNIVGVLIEAIKEQQKEIEMLKSKLN